MKKISMFAALSLTASLLSFATAKQNDADKVPQFEAKDARHVPDIGKWVYFVSNDPLCASLTLDNGGGDAKYTTPEEGAYVVRSMRLKYIGDDKTDCFYQYQNDVQAGGLVWFLPKSKRGHVYWMYGGTQTPQVLPYGSSVRFRVERTPKPDEEKDTKKKVRIINGTEDADIRVWCVRFAGKEDHFIRDVHQGKPPVLVAGVDSGDRGIVVYETLNEKVIVTGDFPLNANGKNVNVKVLGKQGDYKLAYDYFD